MEQRDQPGYYPGFSTLSQEEFWDDATRKTVLDRVDNVPEIRFLSPDESELLEAICGRVLPQDDRAPELRIPIVNYIDEKQHRGLIDGFRFEDMPPDRDALRMGLKAIDEMAKTTFSEPFTELGVAAQETILKSIHDGDPIGDQSLWADLPVNRFWLFLVQITVDAYYAHPWAWDEIGFGGPAYPRGYMRLDGGRAEPWEVGERRYEWHAPDGVLSDTFEPVGAKHPPSGQAGSH